jgi:hypothetical protein
VWTGFPCNKSYFDAIEPTFEELKRLCGEKLLFKDIPRIKETIYLPIITAFEDELRTLTDQHGTKFVKNLFGYMIGKHDFYKVMVFPQKKAVKIQSVNINGTLKWGARWTIPDTISEIRRIKSFNRFEITFRGGWSMSFRIHSAKNEVEPSLKLDINFVGMPPQMGQHEIPLP